MMKLWQKEGNEAGEWSRIVETFTVGRDLEFDILLAEHDVLGSLAHTQMLQSIGLLTAEELASIHSGLNAILEDIRAGRFSLEPGVEDVHSQVELQLTRSIGETGKKIHSGRSRNDQVLLDIKLFLRASLRQTAAHIQALFERLQSLSEAHRERLLPGYTHFQIAMPSSFGLWFGAYAESLCDDMELLLATFRIADKNPLGSGAGYGSSFPLQRKMTTELLGFSDLNYNVVYAQMTRGKAEKAVAMALSSVAATLSKLAYDVCLYMNQNFGFITFPDALTTGSSIMPHKKNPDVFELVRAKCNRIQALPNELTLLTNNLPSGYHRDLQLSKEILFPAIAEMDNCLEMTEFMLRHIIVKDGILDDEKYLHLFSVEAVNELVLAGLPFRDAYRQVGQAIEKGKFSAPARLNHTHEGSIGRLCNEEIRARMTGLMKSLG
ncbi:MAG TPA: argininosuccinate lyase [Saprospiraceae bacterium]|nr:argininosuccinate lyase [Saprospiraceae bacterium]